MKKENKKVKEYIGKKYESYVYSHFGKGGSGKGVTTEKYVHNMIYDETQNHKIEYINSLGLDECRNLLLQILKCEEQFGNNGLGSWDYFVKRNLDNPTIFPWINREYIEERKDEIGNNLPNEIIEQEEYNAKLVDWYENEDFGVERKLTNRHKGYYGSEPKDYTDERIYDKFVRLLKKHGEGNFVDDISYLYEHRKELK